jgi:hypothetical protein
MCSDCRARTEPRFRAHHPECLADIGAVTELDIEHMARGHGQVEAAFADSRDQRLGLRVFRCGRDIDLQSGVAEPLQGSPPGNQLQR